MQNPNVFSENPNVYGHWDTRPQDALWEKMSSHQGNDAKTNLVQFFWDGPPVESGKRRFTVQDIAEHMKEQELTPTKNTDIFEDEEDTILDAKFLD